MTEGQTGIHASLLGIQAKQQNQKAVKIQHSRVDRNLLSLSTQSSNKESETLTMILQRLRGDVVAVKEGMNSVMCLLAELLEILVGEGKNSEHSTGRHHLQGWGAEAHVICRLSQPSSYSQQHLLFYNTTLRSG